MATADPKKYNPNATKWQLSDLAPFRGSSVDEVIAASVRMALARESYNDPGEMKQALRRCGLRQQDVEQKLEPIFAQVGPMIARRHQIVHRMDKNPRAGHGHHPARSISLKTVKIWQSAVADLGRTITSLI